LAVIETLTDNAAYERLLLETIKAVAEAEPSTTILRSCISQ
jgi:hypothetical protein